MKMVSLLLLTMEAVVKIRGTRRVVQGVVYGLASRKPFCRVVGRDGKVLVGNVGWMRRGKGDGHDLTDWERVQAITLSAQARQAERTAV